MSTVLTAVRGTNADLFPEVLRLYVPAGSAVIDTTWGRGVFWKNVDTGIYDLRKTDLASGTDARKLPYEDSSFDAVVFDPPYMHTGGSTKHSLNKCYANNERDGGWRTVLPLYLDAAKEAHRVLRVGGVLILKAQDTVVNHHNLFLHAKLLELQGFRCEDLFVLMQRGIPMMDKRWRGQQHARKNHSYFIVQRKVTTSTHPR